MRTIQKVKTQTTISQTVSLVYLSVVAIGIVPFILGMGATLFAFSAIRVMYPKVHISLLPSCPADAVTCGENTGGDDSSESSNGDSSSSPDTSGSTPGGSQDESSQNQGGDEGSAQGDGSNGSSQGSSSQNTSGDKQDNQENRVSIPEGAESLPQENRFVGYSIANEDQCSLLGKVVFLDDKDFDGLNSLQEENYGTDILNIDTDYDSYFDGEEVCSGDDPLHVPLIYPVNYELVERLKGYILLQVERNGEAWYIYPQDGLRYYLRNDHIAYQIMRFLSLGITNDDLEKIPVGVDERFFLSDVDGDGKFPVAEEDFWLDIDTDFDGLPDKMEEGLGTDLRNFDTDFDGVGDGDEILKNNTDPLGAGKFIYDPKLINRLKGKILLQVESRGEAWYINPKDGKRYYMKDGDAAYQIMRFLSLGITNADINTLPIGTLRGKIQ